MVIFMEASFVRGEESLFYVWILPRLGTILQKTILVQMYVELRLSRSHYSDSAATSN